MAVSVTEVQVTWPTAANSTSVSAASSVTSETATLDGSTISRSIQLKADNAGTPASGDTVDFYALYTLGDPDGAGADEYDTAGHAAFLGRIDTNTEDPGILTVEILPTAKGVKIYAVNNSGGRAITVSATVLETRVS